MSEAVQTPGLDLGDTPADGAGYRVLARKYRPASFDDLIGQDAMVRTISNAVSYTHLDVYKRQTGGC